MDNPHLHINTYRLGSYLSKFTSQEQMHLLFIFNNSAYYTSDELIMNLNKILLGFVGKKLYIYDNGYKWGSENWLATEFYELLDKPLIVTQDKLRDLPKDSNLLIIDDCIYSGGNISRSVDDILESISTSINIDVVVGYGTSAGCNLIAKYFRDYDKHNCKLSLHVHKKIPTITEIVNRDMYQMDWAFFNKIFCAETYRYECPNNEPFQDIALIWFDYKIAAYNSTISCLLVRITEVSKPKLISDSKKKEHMFIKFT